MFRRLSLAFCLLVLPIASAAHEFWIEPVNWQIAPGEMVEAHIRIGQDMKGASISYLPDATKRFEVATPKGVYKAGGQIGSRPVLKGRANDAGLYVVVYVTGAANIDYDERELFETFVKHKDLRGTLEAHAERGLPEVGFTEQYSRYAKSLIAVGHGRGKDRFSGMLTEITALANPYTDDISGGFPVYLSYQSKPRADEQIEIYERNADGELTVRTTRTDGEGRALIDVKPGHDYMLDAVVMRPIEPENPGDPVWESLWANLTFHVPE